MINIKIGGVHHWYMENGQQCSLSGVFRINFKIKGLESKTKGCGSAMLPPFGGNIDTMCIIMIAAMLSDLHKKKSLKPYIKIHSYKHECMPQVSTTHHGS